EDMVADLGAVRSRAAEELAYVRQRFLVECRAAGVVAIDCPYTFSDDDGARHEAEIARRLGYTAKSLVRPSHATIINSIFQPGTEEIAKARQIVAAFEAARSRGEERADVDGRLVEMPVYTGARRLLARVAAFEVSAR